MSRAFRNPGTRAPTLYTFWESAAAGQPPPAYIELCIRTWRQAYPDAEIVRLSHATLAGMVAETLDLDLLRRFPLAVQSDAVSVADLYRVGGVFLDADTIITRPFLELLDDGEPGRLTLFGEPSAGSAHVAFMYCDRPGNPLLGAWLAEIQRRMRRYAGWRSVARRLSAPLAGVRGLSRLAARLDPRRVGWDYLSNGILNPLLTSGSFDRAVRILDRAEHGFILEARFLNSGDPVTDYRKFYFTSGARPDQVLEANRCGVIALHNSWTPREYRDAPMATILSADNLLSGIFRNLLKIP